MGGRAGGRRHMSCIESVSTSVEECVRGDVPFTALIEPPD